MLSINYSTDNISFVSKVNSDPQSLKSLITGSFSNCIFKTISGKPSEHFFRRLQNSKRSVEGECDSNFRVDYKSS